MGLFGDPASACLSVGGNRAFRNLQDAQKHLDESVATDEFFIDSLSLVRIRFVGASRSIQGDLTASKVLDARFSLMILLTVSLKW